MPRYAVQAHAPSHAPLISLRACHFQELHLYKPWSMPSVFPYFTLTVFPYLRMSRTLCIVLHTHSTVSALLREERTTLSSSGQAR